MSVSVRSGSDVVVALSQFIHGALVRPKITAHRLPCRLLFCFRLWRFMLKCLGGRYVLSVEEFIIRVLLHLNYQPSNHLYTAQLPNARLRLVWPVYKPIHIQYKPSITVSEMEWLEA